MKYFVALLILFSITQTIEAQSFNAFVKAGDKAMAEENYNSALQYYGQALSKNEKSIEITYKYAEVARMFFAYEVAESYYNKVIESTESPGFPLALFHLAEVKRLQGQYLEAMTFYEQYLDINSQGGGNEAEENHTYLQKAKHAIAECKWANALLEKPDHIEISQLNKSINTAYSEFAPMIEGDTLYYSSLRFDNKQDEHDPPRKISKVLNSIKGSRGRPMGKRFNEEYKHNAHVVWDKEKKRMYYTLCEYVGEVQINCNIYFREQDKRRRWMKPQKLPETINIVGYTATQPNIGYDTTGTEYLFFASNRPGGKGGLDLWYAKKDKNGEFSNPENISELNTAEDEATPFYYGPGKTLFFSSTGYQGMGGYDIYKSHLTADGWVAVTHTGYPLNSSYNDLYLVINQDSTSGYFSSNRLGSFYLDETNKACCNDIYQVKFLTEATEEPTPHDSLTIVDIPTISNQMELPEPKREVEPEPTTLADFLPLALYFDNDEPDKRTRRTTTKKTYPQTFERYYARKSEYLEEYTTPLDEEERWQAEEELDVFFESNVKRGNDFLNKFSEILLLRLEQGETVEIFIKGFTSPRAKSDYNLSLGKRRVSSLRNHFDRYRDGIFQAFLKNKQLIISEKSFGETTAEAGISDDLDDHRNSVYSVAASKERRVEIVEVKQSKS